MSLIWTRHIKPLGTEQWVAGSTPGLQLEQVAIEGLSLVLDVKGADPPTIVELLKNFKRVIVSVAGTDFVNISGYSLYNFNRRMFGGSTPWSQTESPADTRQLVLFLPFSLQGSVHSPDTLLDLRRTAKGLTQAFVRFELGSDGSITTADCKISVYQSFYTLGSHVRKVGGVRQLRERTIAGVANQKATIQLDHGSDFDDLAGIQIVGITAAGAIITDPVSPLTLTYSEDGTREVFNFTNGDANYVVPELFRARTESTNADNDKGIFYYNFLRDDLRGNNRTLRGLLDGSAFSNLLLEFTPGTAGTYYVLLDRINAAQPEVVPPTA